LKLLPTLRFLHQKEWNVEVFVVRGNPPFDSVLVETIPEGITAWHLSKNELIQWLNFEREIGEK